MPKVVDFTARRQEIVEATWRLIARHGIAATTMRELATELGLANGALLTYFPNKRAILEAAWAHVFAETNARFRSSGAGLRGIRALRAFLVEVLPLDESKALEARIVIAFWEHAALDAEFAAVHDAAMRQWRDLLERILREAVEAGELPRELAVAETIELILAVANGMQMLAVLRPESTSAVSQLAMLDVFLGQLRAQ